MNHSYESTPIEYCFDRGYIVFNVSTRMAISLGLIPPINPTIISRRLGNRDPYMRSLYASITVDNVSNYNEKRD